MKFDVLSHSGKRSLLIGTYVGAKEKLQCEEQLSELESVAHTFGLETAAKIAVPLRAIESSTFLGKGKVEEMKQLCLELDAELVIFDSEISPQQQRNLEKALQRPTIDRAELILGVFAQRAQTKEARIQVELAANRYQLPRLVRLQTHLDRKGGGGFAKGEGEKQLEIDRRILKRRINQLQKELLEVAKQRELQRKARTRNKIPSFAIVGYTNAGKSTLLKALTDADVLIEDKLFATLDTTTRKFTLPNSQEILLIDTVGFIRKLPHLLVAAFRSTLEEAAAADILIHLIDASSPQAFEQADATREVLKELQADKRPTITVLNKVDCCKERLTIDKLRLSFPKTVLISALTGQGLDQLLDLMVREVALLRTPICLRIPQSHYPLIAEIMREGQVLSLEYEGDEVVLRAEIPHALEHKVALFEVGGIAK